MNKITFKVVGSDCYECVLSLNKFVGGFDGIESIEINGRNRIDITHDQSVIPEEQVKK